MCCYKNFLLEKIKTTGTLRYQAIEFPLMYQNDMIYISVQAWSRLCPFHVLRPSQCPIDRNEQRRKPHDDIYNEPIMAVRYIPHRASLVALFLINRWKLRSSNTPKPKRTVTPFLVNVCPPPLPAGFRHRCANAKVRIISD